MDWNWFYSSVSQSAAAIVGIFGAFTMTKIINNQNEFNRKTMRLLNYITESKRLTEKAKISPIMSYNEDIYIEEMIKLRNMLKKNQLSSPEQGVNIIRFSEFSERGYMIDKFNSLLAKCKQKGAGSGRTVRECFIEEMNTYYTKEEVENRSVRIDNAKKDIYFLLTELKNNARVIKIFLDDISINPESSVLIRNYIYGMLVLFWLCIIYPLCLLPNTEYNNFSIIDFLKLTNMFSSKGLILCGLGFGFSILLVVMLRMNNAMKYDVGKIAELEKYIILNNYSGYFKDQTI